MSDAGPTILFTGFEPSGDDHASAVIRELRARHPHVRVFAWGGPKMEAAGATIVEQTGRDAVMGVPGIGKILEHKKINKRVEAWIDEHRPAVHVPVDSPAANFPICKIAKDAGAKVVHLVAPQVWAWGTWRVKKLRRLTSFVCCLLPFEEEFFKERDVPAAFVGHPLFDKPLDLDALDREVASWPRSDGVNLAVMPGSRPGEIRKNFPVLIEAYRMLEKKRPGMRGVVAATNPEVERTLRGLAGGPWPESLRVEHGRTDAVIRWCDAAMVVSGTVTLQIARQAKPMVVVYKSNPVVYWLLARWLLSTTYYTLPNLVAGREIVPELVPYFGGPEPVFRAVDRLLSDPHALAVQREELGDLASAFAGRSAAVGAAEAIARAAGLQNAPRGDAGPEQPASIIEQK
ncbi:MAG: lipid-A-disaccharide synthase [Planctomycetota bacterium]